MSEHLKQHSEPESQNEQDVMGLLKKIQQHLVFLEKKIDLLVGQSSERPFQKKHFSKPFRPRGGGHFNRHDNREHPQRPREHGFNRHSERPSFDKRQDREPRDFGPRKKPFFKKSRPSN